MLLMSMLGCSSPNTREASSLNKKSLVIRQMQSRVFDTGDQIQALQAIISTLQDMGMKINRTDSALKIVEASKGMIGSWKIENFKMVVAIRPVGKKKTQILVRATAFKCSAFRSDDTNEVLDDPIIYQNFFASFAKIMFLDAKTIDEVDE